MMLALAAEFGGDDVAEREPQDGLNLTTIADVLPRASQAVLALSLAIVATGCGPGHAVPGEPVQLRLDAPDTVSAGEDVALHLSARNGSTSPITLQLIGLPGRRGRAAFDVIIKDSLGRQVWHQNAPPPLPHPDIEQVIVGTGLSVTLRPGKVREWWSVWRQVDSSGAHIVPGDYSIIGIVPADSGPALVSPARRLTVLP